MMLTERWKGWARALKHEVAVMHVALRDPRTPWYAKAAAWCVIAYALSPIDLIPDPVPVLGYLDDLVLIPLGVWLVRRLIPEAVRDDSRAAVAAGTGLDARIGLAGAAVIVCLWLLAVAGVAWGALVLWRR